MHLVAIIYKIIKQINKFYYQNDFEAFSKDFYFQSKHFNLKRFGSIFVKVMQGR